jgi:hypothetical protein
MFMPVSATLIHDYDGTDTDVTHDFTIIDDDDEDEDDDDDINHIDNGDNNQAMYQ